MTTTFTQHTASAVQSDLVHPERTDVCNGRHRSEHQFCGGYIVGVEADVDCECPCHVQVINGPVEGLVLVA